MCRMKRLFVLLPQQKELLSPLLQEVPLLSQGNKLRCCSYNREIKSDVYFSANGKNSTSAVCCLAFLRGNE